MLELHHLLLEDAGRPLVCTSGNLSDERHAPLVGGDPLHLHDELDVLPRRQDRDPAPAPAPTTTIVPFFLEY